MIYNRIFKKKILMIFLMSMIISLTLEAQNSGNDTIPNIINEDSDPFIELGYTHQKKSEISGAVVNIKGEQLLQSPVANIPQAFSGRFPGLFTEETYSELSESTTALYVRGLNAARLSSPLVMIDGIIFPYQGNDMLNYSITPSTVESITILKDASTQALFGSQGANGIISIKTRRGKQGPIQINARYDQSFQQVTTKPVFVNSAQYAELRNQSAFNDGKGLNYFYTDLEIENFRSGNSNLYPNNNWYDRYMRDFALMERAEVNVSGGNNKVLYFSNVSFLNQGSQFKTDQTKYNPNVNNIRVNFHSNIDVKLNNYLSTYLYLNGFVRRRRYPGALWNSNQIYSSLFNIPSVIYGPTTPEITDPITGDILVNKGQVITTPLVGDPTYGMLNRTGFYNQTITNVFSLFGLKLDLSSLTKGLSVSASGGFQTNYNNELRTYQNYERWMRTGALDTLMFIKKGSDQNTPLAYVKGTHYSYTLTYKSTMDYERNFGKHKVTGLAYIFFQNTSREDLVPPWLLPENQLNSGFEVTYGFNNKYFTKVDLGYSGSDRYAKGHRFLTTPAISAAWLISKEPFMKNVDWITYLKLRASYGITGNDQDGLSSRYPYLDNITFTPGGPLGYLQYMITESEIGNPNIEPEAFKNQNIGIDFKLFNTLSLSLDVFKERTNNMVVTGTGTIPLYQGIPLNIYPAVNQGIFENKGYDLSANYDKIINKNIAVSLGGFLSYAKNTIIRSNETERSEDYVYRTRAEGYSAGQEFGYLIDYSNGNGFFNSSDEIANKNLVYEFGTPRIGDLVYQDLNKDGIINEKDQAPIGNGAIPRYYYGISGGVKYKNFDVNLLFQGVGHWYHIYGGVGVWEANLDGIYGSLHQNAWTPERYENKEKITAPALSLTTSTSHQPSDYYCYNRAYLRLKNIELGYTLPDRITKSLSMSKIRFLLSGQNLFTWDKMKSDDFGPEGSYASIPVYRVFNIGLSIDF